MLVRRWLFLRPRRGVRRLRRAQPGHALNAGHGSRLDRPPRLSAAAKRWRSSRVESRHAHEVTTEQGSHCRLHPDPPPRGPERPRLCERAYAAAIATIIGAGHPVGEDCDRGLAHGADRPGQPRCDRALESEQSATDRHRINYRPGRVRTGQAHIGLCEMTGKEIRKMLLEGHENGQVETPVSFEFADPRVYPVGGRLHLIELGL
jgi:hypothetical protein